jgi:hypothetical protein
VLLAAFGAPRDLIGIGAAAWQGAFQCITFHPLERSSIKQALPAQNACDRPGSNRRPQDISLMIQSCDWSQLLCYETYALTNCATIAMPDHQGNLYI